MICSKELYLIKQGLYKLKAKETKMDSNLIEKQTAYMPVVDPSSPLVSSLSKVYLSPLASDFGFSPLLSLLPNLLFYNTP